MKKNNITLFKKIITLLFIYGQLLNFSTSVLADVVYQDSPDIPDDWQGACVSAKFGSQQAALDYDGKIETPYSGNNYCGQLLTSDGWILADVTGAGAGQIKCKTTMYNHVYSPSSTPVNMGVSAQTLKPFSVSGAGIVATTITVDFNGLMVTDEPSTDAADWAKSKVEYLAEIQQFNSGSGEREIVGANTFDGVAWVQENGNSTPNIVIPATYVWMEGEGEQPNSWNSNPNLEIKKVVNGAAGAGEISIDSLAGDTKTQAQAQLTAGRNVYYLTYSETFNFNANAGETYFLYMDLQSTVETSCGDWETTYALSDFSNTIDFTIAAGGETVTTQLLLDNTQTISGNNPFGGTSSNLTLDGATLNFTSNSGLAENLALAAGTQSTLNTNGSSALLSGVISGTGNLLKEGNGTLTLTGNNTSTGTLDISSGTGVVNGTWGGNVNVGQSGYLQGTGQIDGNLTANGMVRPGNSIGTLVIAGNYTQATGSTLEVEYNNQGGAGNVDFLDITGQATIQNNTNIKPINEERITKDLTYTFMEADAGIVGNYTAIDDTSAFINYSIQKAAGDTQYQLLVDKVPYSSLSTTHNQRNVTTALDTFAFTGLSGDQNVVISRLESLSQSQVNAAFDSLIPAVAYNTGLVARNDQRLFESDIRDHLYNMRKSIVMHKSIANRQVQTVNTSQTEDFQIIQAVAKEDRLPSNWVPFANSLNSIGSIDRDNNAPGIDWYTAGMSFGTDYIFCDNMIAGISGGGLWSSIDGEDRSGSARIDSLKTSGYASIFNDKAYLDFIIGYGRNWNESDRPIDFMARTAEAEWESDIFSMSTGSGYMFQFYKLNVIPSLYLDYMMLGDESYTETKADSLNLKVDSEDTHSLLHTLGTRISYDLCSSENLLIRPELQIFWAHEYLDTDVEKKAWIFGNPFNSRSVEIGSDSIILGFGLNIGLKNSIYLNMSYSAECANEVTAHRIKGGCHIQF